MALSDLTAKAVLSAVAEFDRRGRDAFLKKYGFRKSRGYLLQHAGNLYNSKPIVGAAHGYLPNSAPLKFNDFSGGEATVQKTLEQLGFTVVVGQTRTLPSVGEILTNREIVLRFNVGNMGGMRKSTQLNLLVLISDPFKGLYQDRWDGDVLHYTGMGPSGDQSLTYAQNRTLAELPKSEIPVHLLEALEPQKYTYAGEVQLVDAPYQEQQPDDAGNPRKVWMFPIKLKSGGVIPALSVDQARAIEDEQARKARRLSMQELEARAKSAKKKPAVRTAQVIVYVRDASVAEYSKRRANGMCDLCEEKAPFQNRRNEAYLECHHVEWLAQGGQDIIQNTVALCPNCHRKMHILNLKSDKQKLAKRAAQHLGH